MTFLIDYHESQFKKIIKTRIRIFDKYRKFIYFRISLKNHHEFNFFYIFII